MKETGIIMSGNHPKLILDGTKTQTRRVIKPQPTLDGQLLDFWTAKGRWRGTCIVTETNGTMLCPYGQVGDRLYLKESHKLTKYDFNGERWIRAEYRFEYRGDNCIRHFKWDDIPQLQRKRLSKILTWGRWRSGRFMYKFLARIWLEITELRAERLQEITKMDAKAEGSHFAPNYLDAFRDLWDSLNAKRGYSWEVNPWVWPIGFKVVQ